jgi:hypothetical protein
MGRHTLTGLTAAHRSDGPSFIAGGTPGPVRFGTSRRASILRQSHPLSKEAAQSGWSVADAVLLRRPVHGAISQSPSQILEALPSHRKPQLRAPHSQECGGACWFSANNVSPPLRRASPPAAHSLRSRSHQPVRRLRGDSFPGSKIGLRYSQGNHPFVK